MVFINLYVDFDILEFFYLGIKVGVLVIFEDKIVFFIICFLYVFSKKCIIGDF